MNLVDWYLEANEADMETIDEVKEKRLLVEKVIERLVHHVSALAAVCVLLVVLIVMMAPPHLATLHRITCSSPW